jgi:hypothetical protein
MLADPLEVAGAAKSVVRARELMFDAVHMKPAGFAALAGKVRELIVQWVLAKKRKGSSIEQPAGKRARMDQDGSGTTGNGGNAGAKKAGRARRGAAPREEEGQRPVPALSCKYPTEGLFCPVFFLLLTEKVNV